MGNRSVIRATGALLALSAVANGVWFVAAGDGEDAFRVSFGLAGALAVGLLWASRARSAPRSMVRSALVAAVVAIGCVATLSAWVDVVTDRAPFSSLLDAVVPQDDMVVDEYPVGLDIALDRFTALSWALTLASVLVAVAVGPIARRRRGRRYAGGDDRWLLVPFVGLVAGALVAQAFVAAVLAALAAIWLDRALAASASAGRDGSPRQGDGPSQTLRSGV